MSGYVLGRDAERDLDNLWDFVAGESVEAAYRLLKQYEAFEASPAIREWATRGRTSPHCPSFFWPVANYLVIYRVKRRLIQIVAVIHGKRDLPAFLRQRGDK